MAPRETSATDQRYAHDMRQMHRVGSLAALCIQALTVAALWDQPGRMWLSIGMFAVMVAINMPITLLLSSRWGVVRSELLRQAINIAATLITNHYTGWPLPAWAWLPYIGTLYSGHRYVTWVATALACVGNAVVALHDGVPWLVPFTFAMLAVLARVLTDARVAIVQQMFEQAEAQCLALEHAELQLRQAQKLEAVGRLASGIAHEMNTPLQFAGDSLCFLEEGVDELLAMTPRDDARDSLDYLRTNMPDAVKLAKEGIARVSAIVSSLREFARPVRATAPMDVNHVVDTALVIAKHEYKYVADLELHLGEVPNAIGNATEIGQVVVNLVVNAAHAIAERHGKTARGRISVTTECDSRAIVIRVQDDGIGIDAETRHKIFEPFFTTKDVGRGTGQGLAISRAIVERHGGALTFESVRGEGSTFVVSLPRPNVAAAA